MGDALDQFGTDPSEKILVRLLALPKAVLFPLSRGGKRRPGRPLKELQERAQLWNRGENVLLWTKAVAYGSKKLPTKEIAAAAAEVNEDEAWRQRVLRPARERNISTLYCTARRQIGGSDS